MSFFAMFPASPVALKTVNVQALQYRKNGPFINNLKFGFI